ncbi:hypothetical protein [Nitrosopumilus sp.]|uniref:hypothetical protein n=1 Tax=Nitrosopumilus sp. TaxID=2024843 RepID=UPI003B5C3DF0
MMINHVAQDGKCVDVFLDCQEPIAKKFLECMTDVKANQILDIAQKPISSKDICKKLPFSDATVYRKISYLSEIGLLHLAGIDKFNMHKDIERLRYVRTFFVMSVKCGSMGECQCHFQYPVVQIASKKEFLGVILRTIREHHN